jgi:Protein of unknown function (DUF1302)
MKKANHTRIWVCTTAMALSTGSQAFVLDTGDSGVKARWDNTIKYSNAWRTKSASNTLTGDANQDDGNRNFSRGLISNRLDLLSELDVIKGNFGLRLSGAAWYDTVYNDANDNDSSSTVNALSTSYNHFTHDTEELHGRKAELLDAFVSGKFDLADSTASFRAGKHSVLWGESLFFGANGIAGGQAPVDIVKALSVPNTQFKELIRPTQQISGQFQVNSDLSIGAYYQFRWEKNRFPAVGSYFSSTDTFDGGAERLLIGAPVIPGGAPLAYYHGNDIDAKNSGQGGLQVRFRWGDTDYGLYAIRYHDKNPALYIKPSPLNPTSGSLGDFSWVYPEDITAYGASFSHTFGEVNIAGEISTRHNTPFISDAQLDIAGTGDNDNNPLYAVGNSLHAQVSWLATLGPSFISDEADFLGEVAWNRRLSISKNSEALNPNADRDATNIRITYEPKYRQVMPGVDISVPLGLGWGIGNSSVVAAFNGDRVGDVSIGINAVYQNDWRMGLSYTHYVGGDGNYLDEASHISYQQSLKDRDFASLSIQYAF